jgi:dihydrofolate reductase
MARVVVFNSVTLDGVMQAPGRPDEDRRDGFEHGGWAVPYADPVIGSVAAEGMSKQGGGLLLGRRTYEDFFKVWPGRTDNPFTAILDDARKYVASRTLEAPLPWQNSTLLEGDVGDAVAGLKRDVEGDLTILGSGELIQALMAANLIDEYILFIHPLVLGSGRRLFRDGGNGATLRLIDSKPSTTGVLIATYRPVDGAAGAGSAGSRG